MHGVQRGHLRRQRMCFVCCRDLRLVPCIDLLCLVCCVEIQHLCRRHGLLGKHRRILCEARSDSNHAQRPKLFLLRDLQRSDRLRLRRVHERVR